MACARERNLRMSARLRELNAYVTIERTDKNQTCVAHAALRCVRIAKDLGHRFMGGWLFLCASSRANERARASGGRKRDVVWKRCFEWRRLRRRRLRRPIHIGIVAVAVVIIASHNHLHSKQPISSDPSYLFRTYGYKGPSSLPPSFSALTACCCLPLPACAYQAGALSGLRSTAILQTRHLKLAMVGSLSLPRPHSP